MPQFVNLGLGVRGLDSSLSMMGMALPLRMTSLRDRDGNIVLVSPVRDAASWADEARSEGPVRCVVAPSGLHHLFALEAVAQFPEARLVASSALREKRPDFPSKTEWLEGEGPVPIAPGILALQVLGMPKVGEWVFLHEDSKTLVVTDLLFHLLEPGFLLGLATRMFGTYRRLAVSRLFTSGRTERAPYDRSLKAIEALDFDRLVMAHGTPILEGARARVVDAFACAP
jgi:hypothetical protein